ncbi:MAG: toll/interleukin-1 receptor domain-containing protein [Stenomitos rutilans HA7619-LM2]|jgi:hypothetical protein|nr:toll/interleukin-1 receptor domain-containing protein [Stenomitos rutilans HA7619-LM2]
MATLFFSYSHRDETLRDELEVHLAMLKRQGVIETWHDRRITAGEEFDKAISKNLEEADIILLLVSPDFLASSYCYDVEMQRALERHEQETACVMPVILRPCDWRTAPFGKLLVMPTDGKAVSKFPDKDDAFLEVVTEIRKAVTRLKPPEDRVPQPSKSYNSTSKQYVIEEPRSSNLRIQKTFSDRDRDRFLEGSFEYIANFFENSLAELSTRNAEVETSFKRIDTDRFSSVVYIAGKIAAQCQIWQGGVRPFMSTNGIAYSHNASNSGNGFNELLSVADDSYDLFLQPMGMAIGGGQNAKKLLSLQGGAEYFWEMLIKPLQHR